ncbi:Yos1-like protein [Raphanus sativus]|nr:Yos1-like protein [Raphanus sativus]
MGFWTLMEGLLLFANALAILNEDRFLAPKGWTLAELHQTGKRNSLKGQIVGLIHACQYMRLPLMLFNLIVIVFKLFSEWNNMLLRPKAMNFWFMVSSFNRDHDFVGLERRITSSLLFVVELLLPRRRPR